MRLLLKTGMFVAAFFLSGMAYITLYAFDNQISGHFFPGDNAYRFTSSGYVQQVDTTTPFRIKYVDKKGFVAFDNNDKPLFIVYPFDNGPDYLSEGLFRIIKQGKIGFANGKGEIVIPPRFTAVFPFHGGMAAFCDGCSRVADGEYHSWENGQWGFINPGGRVVITPQYDKVIEGFRNGMATVKKDNHIFLIDKNNHIIKPDTMNYHRWIDLLGDATILLNKTHFDNRLIINRSWSSILPVYGSLGKKGLKMEVAVKKGEEPVLTYFVLPWQDLFEENHTDPINLTGSFYSHHVVTEYALVFVAEKTITENPASAETKRSFQNAFNTMIDAVKNGKPDNEQLNTPEGIQLIKARSFTHYIELEVALPGSRQLPSWAELSTQKMLHLTLVPDMGPVTESWIKPDNETPDSGYLPIENKLIAIFDHAINNSLRHPGERENIFNHFADSILEITRDDKLIKTYTNRLRRWLSLKELSEKPAGITFPDYTSKLTRDQAVDYMPDLYNEFNDLPVGDTGNFNELLQLFLYYKAKAKDDPGKWVEGNMVLGAKPKEYRPSKAELMLAEIGMRLQTIVNQMPENQRTAQLKMLDIQPDDMVFTRFSFIHVDVMGSGRFFYVDKMEEINLLDKNDK